MGKTELLKHRLLVFGLPLLMMLLMVGLVKSSLFHHNTERLSIGITLDLVLTIPFVYFLLIRKTQISKLTVVSMSVVGIMLAGFILPVAHQFALTQIKTFFLPILEGGLLLFLLVSFRRTAKQYKLEKGQTPDFFTALTKAADRILPQPFGNVLITEIAVMYYGLFPLPKKKLSQHEFTYHKKSGIVLVLYTFIGIVFIETFAVHLLAHTWSPTLAWVLTALSIYSCFQVFALIRSMPQRPIFIEKTEKLLYLRYGFFSETTISIEDIEEIELTSRTLRDEEGLIQFSPFGLLDTHNMVFRLKNEQIHRGLYGRKKKYTSLYVYVDDKVKFKQVIDILPA